MTGQERYAKDTALRLTLREMQRDIRNPSHWIAILAVGCVLGIIGPFETGRFMVMVPRIAYWTAVAIITFWSGSFVAGWSMTALRRAGLLVWPSALIAGTIAGLGITSVLIGLNFSMFGTEGFHYDDLWPMALNVVAISVIVTMGFVAIEHRAAPNAETQDNAAQAPDLLTRLPIEKRGALVSLSVNDHYVSVATDKGEELLLMRLGDAIKETQGVKGLQVHRSHWIAISQVSSVKRDGAKAILTMTNGLEIPVSRTYIPKLKEVGLLPG